jgi:hypothetical protein
MGLVGGAEEHTPSDDDDALGTYPAECSTLLLAGGAHDANPTYLTFLARLRGPGCLLLPGRCQSPKHCSVVAAASLTTRHRLCRDGTPHTAHQPLCDVLPPYGRLCRAGHRCLWPHHPLWCEARSTRCGGSSLRPSPCVPAPCRVLTETNSDKTVDCECPVFGHLQGHTSGRLLPSNGDASPTEATPPFDD